MHGLALAITILCAFLPTRADAQEHPWSPSPESLSIAERVSPPPGFIRIPAASGSFAAWLRSLPLRPGRPPITLYDGERKTNQRAHHAVVDLDVGTRDLQQCADAIIRLRAEYLRATPCADDIAFNFTSGDTAHWRRWKAGFRPLVDGAGVEWNLRAAPDASYDSFRRYLDTVFTYAGSFSLSRELQPVRDARQVRPGHVFIQGGFPGHAVLVVDVAEQPNGSRVFLLAQSFMPAQDVHVLLNPGSDSSPWFHARASGALETPEWLFEFGDLRRFAATACD